MSGMLTAMYQCRRYFAAAVNTLDVPALLRSKGTGVQLTALRACNILAHTPDALTVSDLACFAELLAVPGGNMQLSLRLQCYASRSECAASSI